MKKMIIGLTLSLFAVGANAALINIYESGGGIGSIAQAEAIISGSAGPDTTAYSDNIWFSDAGTNFHGYGVGSAFPGGHNTTFVLTATGMLDTSVYSHLHVGHDDGFKLDIANSTVYSWNGNTDLRHRTLFLGADLGLRSFDMLYWENAGEADLFVMGYRRDTRRWEKAAITNPVPEPGSLALLGLGLAGLGISRRKAKA